MQGKLDFTVNTPKVKMQPPNLTGVKMIGLDTETTGLNWRGHDEPTGFGIYAPGLEYYFGWAHQGGGNMDKAAVSRWANDNLKGKEIALVNPSFDISMMLKAGVDLEKLGCRPRCVQYYYALLNEQRRKFDLENMSLDFLKKRKKVMPSRMPINVMPAWEVAPYCINDAQLTYELCEFARPQLRREELLAVAELEDNCAYPTLFMEKQGAKLNMPKLAQWRIEAKAKHAWLCTHIANAVGFQVSPNKATDLNKLFRRMGISVSLATAGGDDSYTEQSLLLTMSTSNTEQSRVIGMVLAARQISSLCSKYLDKYWREAVNGRLYYNLNQLRGNEYGTITGRYSSSSVNIQQVFSEERQDESTRQWIIRELFIPDDGYWLSADASQIEFRIFAHYSHSARLIKAYVDDPDCDFHEEVAKLIGWKRKRAKNFNFGKIYGMGLDKVIVQLGCSMEEGEEINKEYEAMFPEASRLMWDVIRIVKRRGYAKTLLGRRRRYPLRDRLHSALNAMIQGTAADLMKQKIVKIYSVMKNLGFKMQMTVHDEVDGTVHPDADLKKIEEVFNEQEMELRVPILWKVKKGESWRLAA